MRKERKQNWFLIVNYLVICSIAILSFRGLDRHCDYCGQRDHYRESLVERYGRARTDTPLLHMACMRYLCETNQLKSWRESEGWEGPDYDYDALKHPERQER